MQNDQPAAVLATYADYRRIPTRKVLRLILEVPIEHEAETFEKIGFPGAHGDVWCAVARTVPPQQRREPPPKPTVSHAVRDAALTCRDPDFWQYLLEYHDYGAWDAESAAVFVRTHCGVKSRRDITPGSTAEKRWNGLLLDWGKWRTERNWPR